MPRYFVRLEPNGFEDEEGEELPGPSAAEQLADNVLVDLLKNRTKGEFECQRLIVKDEEGNVICERGIVLH